jgi:hypothetical protein
LIQVVAKVDEEDAKVICLNKLPSKYSSVIFTLTQMSSQTLKDMILALLVEEKRTLVGDIESE